MFGLVRQTRRRQTDKSVSAASYAVSGSAGLPGPFLRQQVLDRVLDPDTLVHPLGIFWKRDAGGEKTHRHLNVKPQIRQKFGNPG